MNVFMSFITQFKIEVLLPLIAFKNGKRWNNVCFGVKTQMPDVEGPVFVQFCLILSSVAIVRKVAKNRSYRKAWQHIHGICKSLSLQFHFIKKGKP